MCLAVTKEHLIVVLTKEDKDPETPPDRPFIRSIQLR
jgi:hypothetical protein